MFDFYFCINNQVHYLHVFFSFLKRSTEGRNFDRQLGDEVRFTDFRGGSRKRILHRIRFRDRQGDFGCRQKSPSLRLRRIYPELLQTES
jgi:hypothetical protein